MELVPGAAEVAYEQVQIPCKKNYLQQLHAMLITSQAALSVKYMLYSLHKDLGLQPS